MYLLSLNLSSFISINFYFFPEHDNFSSYQHHCLIPPSSFFPSIFCLSRLLISFSLSSSCFIFSLSIFNIFFILNLFYFFSYNFYIFFIFILFLFFLFSFYVSYCTRALCTRHIGDWLPLDPVRLYKDDYLKYIGWMCFDYSAAVRKEAVRSVGKLLKVNHPTFPVNQIFLKRHSQLLLVIDR